MWILAFSIAIGGELPLPSDPSQLRVYVYRLPDDLACCFPTPASTCSAFGRNGSGRLRSWPNFAEAHVGAVFERSGQVTADPRRAHVFYLPACLISTFMQLRERRKNLVALWAEPYERRLVALMDSVGPFWRDQRHRHMLHRAQCNQPHWSKRLLPELWPPSISHAAIELCFEVATGARAGLSPSQWGPHVLLPYFVAPEEYRPVPTRAQFLARQSIMGFCGSPFAGREYVVRALANLSRAQLIMPPGSQALAINYLSQGRPYLPRGRAWFKRTSPSSPSQDRWASSCMHALYSEVQFALMPTGDTIFRRAAAAAIAAGAIPVYSPDRRTGGVLQRRFMPFRECLPAGLQVDEALGAAVPEAELAANALGTYKRLVDSPALDRMLQALTEVQTLHNYHSLQFADCLSLLIVGAIRAPAQRPPAAGSPPLGANGYF
jgi:hypothetical protein